MQKVLQMLFKYPSMYVYVCSFPWLTWWMQYGILNFDLLLT